MYTIYFGYISDIEKASPEKEDIDIGLLASFAAILVFRPMEHKSYCTYGRTEAHFYERSYDNWPLLKWRNVFANSCVKLKCLSIEQTFVGGPVFTYCEIRNIDLDADCTRHMLSRPSYLFWSIKYHKHFARFGFVSMSIQYWSTTNLKHNNEHCLSIFIEVSKWCGFTAYISIFFLLWRVFGEPPKSAECCVCKQNDLYCC